MACTPCRCAARAPGWVSVVDVYPARPMPGALDHTMTASRAKTGTARCQESQASPTTRRWVSPRTRCRRDRRRTRTTYRLPGALRRGWLHQRSTVARLSPQDLAPAFPVTLVLNRSSRDARLHRTPTSVYRLSLIHISEPTR